MAQQKTLPPPLLAFLNTAKEAYDDMLCRGKIEPLQSLCDRELTLIWGNITWRGVEEVFKHKDQWLIPDDSPEITFYVSSYNEIQDEPFRAHFLIRVVHAFAGTVFFLVQVKRAESVFKLLSVDKCRYFSPDSLPPQKNLVDEGSLIVER